MKSYRPHLVTQASYGPKLHFAKCSAKSSGNQPCLRRFYVYLRGRLRGGPDPLGPCQHCRMLRQSSGTATGRCHFGTKRQPAGGDIEDEEAHVALHVAYGQVSPSFKNFTPQTRDPVDPFKKLFQCLLKAFKGGPDPPGDVHEDRRKTFLNRASSPAISLNIWQHEA